MAHQAMGDGAEHWMRSRNPAFGGQSPECAMMYMTGTVFHAVMTAALAHLGFRYAP